MEMASLPVIGALWLGILTSVSPCPLAANIAAVSFIAKGGGRASAVVSAGFAYTLGRSLAYMVLGFIVSASLLNVPAMAYFLQTSMPRVLGPVLVVTGLMLLEVFSFSMSGLSVSQQTAEKLRKTGAFGTFVLGALFALAFCPVSAAFFFGSLIPLALKQQSPIALPFFYGIGTALPVLVFALVIMFGVKQLGSIFNAVTKVEYWVRRVTASVLILAGIHLSLLHIFNVNVFV
jgi:cytochrome c biogenesis protein CcdA